MIRIASSVVLFIRGTVHFFSISLKSLSQDNEYVNCQAKPVTLSVRNNIAPMATVRYKKHRTLIQRLAKELVWGHL